MFFWMLNLDNKYADQFTTHPLQNNFTSFSYVLQLFFEGCVIQCFDSKNYQQQIQKAFSSSILIWHIIYYLSNGFYNKIMYKSICMLDLMSLKTKNNFFFAFIYNNIYHINSQLIEGKGIKSHARVLYCMYLSAVSVTVWNQWYDNQSYELWRQCFSNLQECTIFLF